jgi:hypothetical protein
LSLAKKMAQKDPIKEFLAGGVGGSCLVLAGHPLDTIKVILTEASLRICEFTV